MNGIININKPSGISSNKVVNTIKKAFNQKKVGHLGTLDPLASGVLPVCIGKATKLFDLFLNKTKEYVAEFTFGVETDTLDSEGIVVNQSSVLPNEAEIKKNLVNFLGKINQLPPKYSAKNVDGQRAYDLARKGIEFELKPKEVEIFKFELLGQINENTFEFLIDCSSGTYIRSLARDLGLICNSYAYMSKLTRTRAGNFELKNSVELEKVSLSDILTIEQVLDYEKISLEEKYYDKLKNGNEIFVCQDDKENILVYCKNKLFGIADIKNQKLKVKINLYDEE